MKHWWSSPDYAPWLQLASAFALRLVGAVFVLVIGLRIARVIAHSLERALQRTQMERTASAFLARTALIGLQVVLALAVVQVLGVPMSSMFAILGAAGLAIGLALKDSLANIASGVLLVALRPFKVGDVVTLRGTTGTVEAISIFQTRLRGGDNQTVTLLNSLITADSIVNLTPDTMRRVEFVIGIGYGDDIERARAVALSVITADPRVLREPEPEVLVFELAASTVNLGMRCHVANDDHFAVRCALLERIKLAFDAAQISLPNPQHDAHIYMHTPAPAAITGR